MAASEQGAITAALEFGIAVNQEWKYGFVLPDGTPVSDDRMMDLASSPDHKPDSHRIFYRNQFWYHINGSDGTLILGEFDDANYAILCCKDLKKPYIKNPSPDIFGMWVSGSDVSILHVVGDYRDKSDVSNKVAYNVMKSYLETLR